METYKFENLDLSVSRDGKVLRGSEWCMGWPATNNKYLQIQSGLTNRSYYLHRLIGHAFIENPAGEFKHIDHINGDKKDNREQNLRWISRKLNAINKSSRNIQRNRRFNKWHAKVAFNFITYDLGMYKAESDALEVARDFKQLIFYLGYLEPIENNRDAWEKSHRVYLHGNKAEFALALERLNLRAGRNRRLRASLFVLHNTFRAGPTTLPKFSHQ